MVRRDVVRIFVDVPEPEAPFVRQGTPVRVRIQALNDCEFDAVVTRTSWALDPASRTLRTEIEVPNPTDELRPGMYAYAIITAEHDKAFTLPAEALLRQDDTFYCWEYRDGRAVQTLVRRGQRVKDRIEVLKKRLPGPTWSLAGLHGRRANPVGRYRGTGRWPASEHRGGELDIAA